MTENIPLPRKLTSNGWEDIHPISVSINLNSIPLSDASMTLPREESLQARDYVELFTVMGSAGVFRVRSPQEGYGINNTTAELEHAVVEVGDYLVLHKYDEMMAAGTAMQTIFNHYRGSRWQLGSVTALGNTQIAVQTNYDRVLEAMLALLEQKPDCIMSFDFSTTPWTINIVAKDSTVTAEGRLSRNVNYARITYDDTELCTRAYYEKPKATTSSNQPTETEWLYVDADTMSTYGLIEREVKTGSNFTADEALRIATEYIRQHKNPRISIEMGAEELSSITGEAFDTFTIGKLFRLVLIDYNMLPVEKNITGLTFPDVYGQPRNITVKLDAEEDTLITFIHDMDAKGGGGGGGRRSKQQDDELKLTWTEWINEKTKIGMVVGVYDGEYKIQAGEISLAISQSTGETIALISADHIVLDGQTTVSDLLTGVAEATMMKVADLRVQTETVKGLNIGGTGHYFTFGTYGVEWKNITVVTDVGVTMPSITRSSSRYFLYASSSGSTTPSNTQTGRVITGFTDGSVSPTTETIYYLGRNNNVNP